MKYRYLGKSGLLVSRICLGTMTFGAPWGCDEKESHAIMARYFAAGGNFIDTADVYAAGRTEEIIGSYMPSLPRDQIILASKSYFPLGNGLNTHGSSRKHIISSCENSLRRLKTDYLDIYYLHGPDPLVPAEEVMETLDILVRQGKILYPACSNMYGWQIVRGMEKAQHAHRSGFICGQYLYNLIQRDAEAEVFPAMLEYGVGIMAWSPLAGGLLTGKYKAAEKPPAGSRLEARIKVDGPRFWHKRGFSVVERLQEVSRESGIPAAKLALAWPLTRKFMASVIIGARNVHQLEENLAAGDWDMSADLKARLDEISQPEHDYLQWFNDNNYRRFADSAEHLNPGTGVVIDPA